MGAPLPRSERVVADAGLGSAPERLVFWSTESGVYQVHVWDRETGERRQVTDHPVGVLAGALTLDGERVLFWQDETGSEAGQWYAEPFTGGRGRALPRRRHAGVEPGPRAGAGRRGRGHQRRRRLRGLRLGRRRAGEGDLAQHRGDLDRRRRARSRRPRRALAPTDRCSRSSTRSTATRCTRRCGSSTPGPGSVIAEQVDEGMALHASCWSPVAGDQRLVVIHEREGEERPAIWNVATGAWTEPRPRPHGPGRGGRVVARRVGAARRAQRRGARPPLSVRPRDGDAHADRARCRLDRRAPRCGPTATCGTGSPAVSIRPSRSTAAGADVVRAHGDPAPAGRPFHSWHFDNGEGDRVHGFYVTPEGDGPFPVMMFVHGGPTGQDTDAWDPEVLAYVDMGFAVGMVNYRGSTGYGRAWRDRLDRRHRRPRARRRERRSRRPRRSRHRRPRIERSSADGRGAATSR